MCEAKNTRFFRPWNASDTRIKDTTVDCRPVSDDGEERTGTPTMKREEDNQSISSYDEVSAASSSEHEIVSDQHRAKRRRLRRRSESSTDGSSRSCSSVTSEDANRSNSLDLLNNFVLASSPVSPLRRPRDVDATSVSGSSFPVVVNSSPIPGAGYPADYLQRLGLSNGAFDSPTIPAALHASAIATTGQPFYYEFPPVQQQQHHHHHHLPQGLYASSMEQAVEMIHRQDAVAKQMKKLRPKKFRCEHCDVAFSNNGQLKGHIRIHTGERPFKCDAEGCGKSFTRNEELTRHKRIHTGLRPHACLVCGKRFGRKDHLKKHTRTHENRDPYRMSAAALGMFALSQHAHLPQGHPFPSYVYPL